MTRTFAGAVLALAACGGSGSQAPAQVWDWDRTIDWRDRAGHYLTDAGDTLLAVEGANGGLRVYDLANDVTTRLLPVAADSGIWIQPGGSVAWSAAWHADTTLHWAGEKRGSARRVPGPYRQEAVRIPNGDITIAATLFIPASPGPHPGVIYIHGSGASDRDSGWRVRLAVSLARAGFVALLPDKRGSGLTGGDWRAASFDELAEDARATLDFLRGHQAVDAARTGVLGMSQGGWIAPIVAVKDPSVPWVVNMSAAATSADVQLVHEVRQDLRNGHMPGLLARWLAPYFAGRAKRRQADFWTANAGFDPMPFWRQTTMPVLVLYGEADERDNVPVMESTRLLEPLAPRVEVHVIPGAGHGLEVPARESFEMSTSATGLLIDWLHRQTK